MYTTTETDALRIEQVMTPNPCTVALDLSLADAQERMYVNNIRHLVVQQDGHVHGVLSTRDVLLLTNLMSTDAKKLSVAAAMTRRPYTCEPDTPVATVVREMEEHRYGCAVVVRGHEPVGMFTTTDALRVLRAPWTHLCATPMDDDCYYPFSWLSLSLLWSA